MNAIETLEELLTVKSLNKEKKKRAVDALYALFAEKNNAKLVAGYLIKLHYSVCQDFFEHPHSPASEENITAVAEALINDEQFKKANIIYQKGFSAVFALASHGEFRVAYLILTKILSLSEKRGTFPDSCVKNFRKLIIDNDGFRFIVNLSDLLTNGDIKCEEVEQKRLAKFLKLFDDDKPDEIPRDSSPELAKIHETISEISGKIRKIDETQEDILQRILKLTDNRSNIDSLVSAIERRDNEISAVKKDLTDEMGRALSLSAELETKESQLAETNERIDDLTGRLRSSLKMDEISRNQELIKLKDDISETLKFDYADFTKSRERPYSEDLFEAYIFMLDRVFKLLRRQGIPCQ